GQGVATELLQHALLFAKTKDRKTVSLETGTQNYFDPARKLYKKYGFVECGPFSDYKLDPNSYFMTLSLTR
ncbi:MAG: GNAT family N-acetyltransferase, partial [Bdellovibrionales bacterium]